MAEGASSPQHTSLDILTLGCRLNTYESEVMRQHARAAGLSDAVIINTCAVTGEAVRQARQAIRRAARTRPGAAIIVTGCAAQIDPQTFARMPEVSFVLGNEEKMKAETFSSLGASLHASVDASGNACGGATPAMHESAARVQVNDIMSVRETAAHLVDGLSGRARAFVQVQTGCDHRCTFCVIPFGRGNARSVPAGEVVSQVRRLVETGHYEIVLTGVDLTSWGGDLPNAPRLGNLIARILKLVPDLRQLRLSSIDAIEIDDSLFELLAGEERIAPHLHLSLQSGDDMILKRMKRRHSRADAISLCSRLRRARPDMAFGADLIAGFPTETEDMFANTLASVDECGIDYLHVFPFSARPGTPAARMPQLAREVIRERAARLREKGAACLEARLDRHVGSHAVGLVETDGRARLADFAPVRIEGPCPEPGRPARLRLVSRSRSELIGQTA